MKFKKELIPTLDKASTSQVLFVNENGRFTIEATASGVRVLGTSDLIVNGEDLQELARVVSEAYKIFLKLYERKEGSQQILL